MGRIDIPGGGQEVPKLYRRVGRSETGTPSGNTSVSRGSTRFLGNESLKVVGSALVSGWLIVTGTLKIVGALLIEGATTLTGNLVSSGAALFTGAFTSRGTTRFEGDTSQIGPLHIIGNADLNGNLTVLNAGRVRVGILTLDPTAGAFGGALTSPNSIDIIAPSVNASANLYAGGTVISTGTLTAESAANIGGALRNQGIANQTLGSNVYADTAGRFWKVTSARRFKIDPEKTALAPELLRVPVVSWIDRGTAERYADLLSSPRPFTEEQQAEHDDQSTFRRVPGVIAEEVLAAGGEQFVTFTADGEIEGVTYDRYALARTELLARETEVLRLELADLRAEVAGLRTATAGE